MSVRLRLRRTGSKNKACFRIVATDRRSPRDGRFIEILGFYDPRRESEKIDLERTDYWISNGAQPSKTVAAIINRAKTSPPLVEQDPSLPPAPAIETDVKVDETAAAAVVAEESTASEKGSEPDTKAAEEAVDGTTETPA